MKLHHLTVLTLSTAMLAPAFADDRVPAFPEETKEQRDTRMEWWREARFGMFIHWGLYAGLEGDWKGKNMGGGGMEWMQQRAGVDTYTYAAEAIPKFKPKEGFAEEWAALAEEAGCKYMVLTSKHHDGFGLFDSAVTDYDAASVYNRDLVKEYTESARAHGLKVGYYHSVIDWHHPQYDYTAAKGLPYPLAGKPSPNGKRDHAKYVKYLHQQVDELMSNYGKVDILWWDYSKPGAEGEFWEARDLVKMVRAKQPDIIMNNRLFRTEAIKGDPIDRLKNWKPGFGDFTTPEQHIPSTGMPGVDWESCMTMNGTWGWSKNDKKWKSNQDLLAKLVEIASKGGNFLLNIGPLPDGSIPPESVEAMKYIGAWMKVNGDSIYGTEASTITELSWQGRATVKHNDDGSQTIYMHVTEWPKDGKLTLKGVSGESATAKVLGGEDVAVTKTDDAWQIAVPKDAPHPQISVVAVTIQ